MDAFLEKRALNMLKLFEFSAEELEVVDRLPQYQNVIHVVFKGFGALHLWELNELHTHSF